MKCPKCEKQYEDSFVFCPHCGEPSPEPTKKCPLCQKVVKADAIKCRYCHADLTESAIKEEFKKTKKEQRKQFLKRFTTPKAIGIAVLILIMCAGIGVGAFFIIRKIQKGHYEAGWDYLNSENYERAFVEFEKAGGYSDAGDIRKLTAMFAEALDAMDNEEWKEAHSLFRKVQGKSGEFLNVAGRIHYLEHCPQNPMTFSLSQVQGGNGICSIPVRNLLGEEIDSLTVSRGWSYDNHGRPDCVGSINIRGGVLSRAIICTDNDSRVKEEGSLFVVGRTGVAFDLSGSGLNYHFVITNASVNWRPTGFSDISFGYDPIFDSLSLSITATPK